MEQFLKKAKEGATLLAQLNGGVKKEVLEKMAKRLRDKANLILKANALDMEFAKVNNLSSALQDRLFLDKKRIDAMATSLEEIAMLKEPVGRVLDGWVID
ncbi:MAG: gamma-glutamyl-phosphate reductase, partial [Epsilonproteobacteria bacterium]|nr:gamma-glutamyl-phosphate reductase [Campylobacterota bacterium]